MQLHRSPSALAALCLVSGLVTAPVDAQRYADGERIEVTGRVTDPGGNALGGLEVLFVASQEKFDLRTLGKTTRRSATVRTRTDEAGNYALSWAWDRYYNAFELVVGVQVQTAEGDELRPLERIDLTARVEAGSPVIAAVAVEASGYVSTRNRFLETVRSAAERRVLESWGEPDSIERVLYEGRGGEADRTENTWWYFASGKCFTFRDGVLAEEFDFDPVVPF